mmetsp:Transcript_1831/g.5341  ORF Transcript_1831/g.5341 Transcript_1831/m.5341 type:complete len:390 (-) Transcript_1831:49-1218(-)
MVVFRCADFLVRFLVIGSLGRLALEVDSEATDEEISASALPVGYLARPGGHVDVKLFDGDVDLMRLGNKDENAAATSNENLARSFRRRSLVHITPPPRADRVPAADADFFAPSCSPSPPLATTSTPNLDDEYAATLIAANRHKKVPKAKRATGGDSTGGLRRTTQPKVTKCRDNAALTGKKSKSKGPASDVTLKDETIVANENIDGDASDGAANVSETTGDLFDTGIDTFNDETIHGDAHFGENAPQPFEDSLPSVDQTIAISSSQASAHGVTFRYEDDGSVSGIAVAFDEEASFSRGGLTIRYDEQGNLYAMEEPSAGDYHLHSSDIASVPIIHSATEETGGASAIVVKEEEAFLFEENSTDKEPSSGPSPGVGPLTIFFFALLLLYE